MAQSSLPSQSSSNKASSSLMHKSPETECGAYIAIVVAMDVEVEAMRRHLDNEEVKTLEHMSLHIGQIEQHPVIILKTGIGKVNAAFGMGLLCHRYRPRLILNTGCAGGLGDADEPGDLIIAKQCVHGDVDASVFGYSMGQVPGMPPSYEGDHATIEMLKDCFPPQQKVHYGTLLTTDSFISATDQRKKLRATFAQAVAVDMEAAAMAQVAFHFKIPFVAMRALSDAADADATKTYHANVESSVHRASDAICQFLKKVKELKALP